MFCQLINEQSTCKFRIRNQKLIPISLLCRKKFCLTFNRRYFETIVIIAKLNKIAKGFIVKYEVSLEVKIIFASYVTRDFLSLFNTFIIFLILYSINLLYSRIINFDFYVIKLFCIILLTKIHSKTLNQRYFNTIASTYTINLTFRPD
jgi:hypothetical protein